MARRTGAGGTIKTSFSVSDEQSRVSVREGDEERENWL
jgi:hypothetical protein